MSRRSGNLYFLIVAGQAICVTTGLWMQYNCIRLATQGDIAELMWSDIAAAAQRSLRDLNAQDAQESGAAMPDRMRSILRPTLPPHCSALVVDRDWRPWLQVAADGEAVSPGFSRESPIAWESTPDLAVSRAGLMRGRLNTAKGPHMAAACALRDGSGFLLVHRPEADIATAAAPFLRSLLAIDGVTLIWTVVLLGVCVHLILARHREAINREHVRSKSDMLRQTQLLIRTRDAVMLAMAKLAGVRDDETGSHLERMSAYSSLLASAARNHPKFAQQISPAFIRLIGFSAVLHDIGKVGIEDRVLRKPGPLTDEEQREMRQHTVLAGDCLGEVAQHLGGSNFLEMAREIAVAHHERWDGTGYPYGLSGEAIPLSARIVAIVDTYDALSSKRVYKASVSHEECVAIIREAAGTHFDPELVKLWLSVEGSFREIAARYVDEPAATGSEAGQASRFVPEAQPDAASAPPPALPVAEAEPTPTSLN